MTCRARAAYRRFVLGGGDLKRRSDRVQVLLRVLLLVALLAAVPAAVWRGIGTHQRLAAVAVEQLASRRAITVEVLGDAVGWPPPADGDGVRGPVSWPTADGGHRVVDASVPHGAHAGDRVTVWLDRHGRQTRPPLDPETIDVRAAIAGSQVLPALVLLPLGLYALACGALNRHRTRRWERAWAEVEPRWTARSG